MTQPDNKRIFSKQRGIASLLILLMIGLSLTAAIVGSVYHLRVTQEQSISVHAQTQAQARAWSAAEVTRQYFEMLRQDATEWQTFYDALSTALASGTPLTLNIGMDDVVAKIIRAQNLTTKTSEGEVPHVTVQITATAADGSRAMSSSTLELMYAGTEPTTGAAVPNNSAINFYGGLKMRGGIDVFKDKGDSTAYEINVIGDVDIQNTSITGVNIIRSTGSIKFQGSSSWFDEMYANCDISLTSSGSASIIQATHNVCIHNTSKLPAGRLLPEVLANGSVDIKGGVFKELLALAGKGNYKNCATGAVQLCTSTVNGVLMAPTPDVTTVKSKGDFVSTSSAKVGELHVEGNIEVTDGFENTKFSRYGGELLAKSASFIPAGKREKIANYNVDISQARPVNIRTETFDVNQLRAIANYIFYVDESGQLRVSVKNIKDVPNGEYYLFNNNQHPPYRDWICSSAKPQPPTGCFFKVGAGWSESNTLITYDKSKKQWKLEGVSLAPGIAFFEGDLHLSSGTYYNTFLTTGNFTTAGNLSIYAPNYAGFNGKHNGKTYAHINNDASGICVNIKFPKVIPTQFCKDGEYLYNAVNGIGNYAVMAGSCADTTCNTYRGGDITTGSSTNIRGAVKAGNLFISSGDTTVHGYITALAQREVLTHTIGHKTTVDLRDLPPGYDPKAGSTVPGGGEAGASGSMDIRWSRYL